MLTDPTRSKGLRKFIPQPDRFAERYGRFTLTPRDLEILDLVYRYRFVEARHVRALISGSDQQITRRLQGLFHGRYLGRYGRRERIRLELDPGAPLIAYGLETNGARALSRESQTPLRWHKDHTRRGSWFLEHRLVMSDFRCALELGLRSTSTTKLVTWLEGEDASAQLTISRERLRRRGLNPDAYFVLRHGDQTRHFFLEADCSTEEHRRITDKFVRYWHAIQAGPFAGQEPQSTRVVILFLTTGAERMNNLVELLRGVRKPSRGHWGGKGCFQFSCGAMFDLARPQQVLGPIWTSVNGPGFSLGI